MRKERPQRIQVDVRRKIGLGHCRVRDEPASAEQALILAREGREQHAARKAVPGARFGEADDRGDIGRIVERAVIKAIARDRLAVAVTTRCAETKTTCGARRGSVPGSIPKILFEPKSRCESFLVA